MSNMLLYQNKLTSPILQERERSNIQIFVKSINNIAIKVNKSDKIVDVKWKLNENGGITQNGKELIFQGQILDDDKTVEECEMCEASVIGIIGKLRGGLQICAKTKDGKKVVLEVSKNEKITDLKKKIQFKLELDPDDQELTFQNQILEDGKTVEQCGINDKSEINIVIKLKKRQIIINTENGRTFTIQVMVNDKIRDVKLKIKEKLGPRSNHQILLFNDEILEDEKTIKEYGIMDNDFIYAYESVRGGKEILKTMHDSSVACGVGKNMQFKKRQIEIKYDHNSRDANYCCNVDLGKMIIQLDIIESQLEYREN